MIAKERIKTDVHRCARCSQVHIQLEFTGFQRPIMDSVGDWEYWALCPLSGDPILLRIRDKEDDNSDST